VVEAPAQGGDGAGLGQGRLPRQGPGRLAEVAMPSTR
jgi:hypothetical protein